MDDSGPHVSHFLNVDHFAYRGDVLCADGVSLSDVAAIYGTPTYVYAQATLQRHVEVLQQSMAGMDTLVCYAVKANGTLSLLQLMGKLGCHFDAVSLGELKRVQAAGQQLGHTILSGVGKRDDEIGAAIGLGVHYISVESAQELEKVGSLAQAQGTTVRVSLRVNPEVDAKTHPYISTGLKNSKFGIAWADAPELVDIARRHPAMQLVGLTCHIGSQITHLAPFEDAARKMMELTLALDDAHKPFTHIGMGGGLGIPYGTEVPPSPAAYGAALQRILAPLNKQLVLEPGRMLVGNAGVLLTQVVRCKTNGARNFVITDAGMNDLMRPALYQAQHTLVPVVRHRDRAHKTADIVGPVCESADSWAKDLNLPALAAGDLLAIRSAGAYGMAMASQYNGRLSPAEVLCQGDKARLIRHRDCFEDLWHKDILLPV